MAVQAIHVYDCMLHKKKLFFCGKGDISNLQKQELPVAAMFVNGSGRN
jgi:ribonuclease BN (tRNA processing enzyme)